MASLEPKNPFLFLTTIIDMVNCEGSYVNEWFFMGTEWIRTSHSSIGVMLYDHCFDIQPPFWHVES